jgi:hypothetical protein
MKRRGALVGLVIALTITTAACGSGGSGGGDAAVSIRTLQAAVSNTEAAPSSRFVMDVEFHGGSAAGLSLRGEGVASDDGKQLQAKITMTPLGTFEERLVGDSLYMNFGDIPKVGDQLPAGKPWVQFTFADLQSATGIDVQQLVDQAKNSGPTQGLANLQGLSGDVEKVGEDTIDGRHATHYRASIDYAKVAEQASGYSPEIVEKLKQLGTVPADVWIDDDDHVVKMHYTIDAGAVSGGSGTADFTLQMSDIGEQVTVEAPPADQTIGLTDFLARTAKTELT